MDHFTSNEDQKVQKYVQSFPLAYTCDNAESFEWLDKYEPIIRRDKIGLNSQLTTRVISTEIFPAATLYGKLG